MIADVAAVSWVDGNQRYLAAELARIEALLAREGSRGDADETRADADGALAGTRDEMASAAAIDVLSSAFGLSRFERDVLLLCAGVEMQTAIARRCAALNGSSGAAYATFGIGLGTFADAHWSALAPDAPLRRWSLVSLAPDAPLTSSPLRIDERVLHFLAGLRVLDPAIELRVRPASPVSLMAMSHTSVADAIAAAWRALPSTPGVMHMHGNDPDGQEDVAATAAQAAGLSLYVLPVEEIPALARDRSLLTTLWMREAVLTSGALFLDLPSDVPQRPALDFVERLRGPVVVAARDPLVLRCDARHFRIDRPNALEQRRLWRLALGAGADAAEDALDVVTSQLRLSARAIARAARELANQTDRRQTPRGLLRTTQRAIGHADLNDLAQRIEPAASWDDLILPEDRLAALHEIGAHVRHRSVVHDTWGFARGATRGLGISALFAGESGTGKTMAAEVLATDLGLELYRIDLSSVVSKYIGETEKNLRRVFDAADRSGVILLFDEADALFGKRSEVRDSHDRYANIEVSYLLQRMEAYGGLAILTTNAKAALDRAFNRRLRFVVAFPFPDVAQREGIWRRAFPPATPTQDLDVGKLAKIHLSGGSIRNVALLAAFRAIDAGGPVTMTHVASAIRTEMAKVERTLPVTETRDWA